MAYGCHAIRALDHATPPGHPERADRIRVIERALVDERFAMLVREAAPVAALFQQPLEILPFF